MWMSAPTVRARMEPVKTALVATSASAAQDGKGSTVIKVSRRQFTDYGSYTRNLKKNIYMLALQMEGTRRDRAGSLSPIVGLLLCFWCSLGAGKTKKHCGGNIADVISCFQNVFENLQKLFLCPHGAQQYCHVCHRRQNIVGHNVAATTCPRFAGA